MDSSKGAIRHDQYAIIRPAAMTDTQRTSDTMAAALAIGGSMPWFHSRTVVNGQL